jgi:hypothetical protein
MVKTKVAREDVGARRSIAGVGGVCGFSGVRNASWVASRSFKKS